jgi:LDH2 family malate/lactate/ureidoglycolate dehydrogenase
LRAADDIAVRTDSLLAFAEALLGTQGVPAADARLTARLLLEADLRGVESHGMVHLVDFYVRRLQQGQINARPNIRVTSDAQAAASIDADNGLGFVAGHRAMHLAIEKARATGAGWVACGNSTHYGAGAGYAMMALEHGMIGFSLSTGGRLMAPPGGLGRAIGLNVLAVAAPTPRGFPYVLDMATSVVAHGKLEIAARRGEPIPEGWAIDSEGQPITDPTSFRPDGLMLPLGGSPALGAFKGFGLAVLADILSGALSGFGTSTEIEAGRIAAHCFGALRIAAFVPFEQYLVRMGTMTDAIKRTPTADGSEVRIPGELEHALSAQRRAQGAVPLHRSILVGYRDAAAELGVPYELGEA